MSEKRKKLTKPQKRIEAKLIDVCLAKQGEYLPVHHGKGSFATTYGNEFLAAFFGLYELYKITGFPNPKSRLSNKLIAEGIASCRGSKMTPNRVDYIFQAHYFRFKDKRFNN